MVYLSTLSTRSVLNLIVFIVFLLSTFYNWKWILRFYAKARKTHLKTKQQQAKLNLPVSNYIPDVALICFRDGCTLAYDHFNQAVPWPYVSMKASMEILPPDQYFRIRREIILKGEIIQNVVKEGNAFSVKLKPPFTNSYVVAKKSVARFRKFGAHHSMPWWNRINKRFR